MNENEMNNNPEMICNYCFDSEIIFEQIVAVGTLVPFDYCCEKCLNCNEDLEEDMFYLSKLELLELLAKFIRNSYVHINEYQLPGGGNESYLCLEEIFSEICDLCGEEIANILVNECDLCEDIYYSEWLPICYLERDSLDWEDFSKNIKDSLRFFDTDTFNRKEELQKLDRFFEMRCQNDFEGSVFRTRVITENEIEKIDKNPETELGKVPSADAKHNRFSPTGISYMYVASDVKTAISELFSDVQKIYAVGEFILEKNLKLINLRKSNIAREIKGYINPFSDEFDSSVYCASEEVKKFVNEIQKPIDDMSKNLEYLPTQILSEYIRSLGYDGFIYDSSKNNNGYNIVLFDDKVTFKRHNFKSVCIDLKISDFQK